MTPWHQRGQATREGTLNRRQKLLDHARQQPSGLQIAELLPCTVERPEFINSEQSLPTSTPPLLDRAGISPILEEPGHGGMGDPEESLKSKTKVLATPTECCVPTLGITSPDWEGLHPTRGNWS